MGRWLLKTEPSDYSWADLERDRRTVWTGVRNALAQKHLREMQAGDEAIVYHTGDERAAVGIARVARGPYPDPSDPAGRLVVVDLAPERPLLHPVTLAQAKADPVFADFALTRLPRLSVMPVGEAHWARLLELGDQGD